MTILCRLAPQPPSPSPCLLVHLLPHLARHLLQDAHGGGEVVQLVVLLRHHRLRETSC